MIEITNRVDGVERIEQRNFKHTKVRERLIDRLSKAKNIISLMKSNLAIIQKDRLSFTNEEAMAYFEHLIKKCEEYAEREKKIVENYELEIEIIGGWKGKSDTRIYMGFDNDIRILVPRKEKLTGKVLKSPKTILKEDINRMIKIVKELEMNKVYTCYEIADMLGLDWKNDIWRNRTKVYFKIYYYPIKFLEATKMIEYGDGTIKRIA